MSFSLLAPRGGGEDHGGRDGSRVIPRLVSLMLYRCLVDLVIIPSLLTSHQRKEDKFFRGPDHGRGENVLASIPAFPTKRQKRGWQK